MHVLVTGATGFLGRRLLSMISGEHEVHILTRRMEGLDDCRRIGWDLSSGMDASPELPSRIDVIIHLAQSLRHGEFPDAAKDIFAVNVAATTQLLEYARRAGARQFILASTGSVYAASSLHRHGEADLVVPENYYAASKLAAEMLAAPYRDSFAVCVLRLFHLYGAGQVGRLMPTIISRIRNGVPVVLQGDDEGIRMTPTHVEDAAAVFKLSMNQEWDGTFNVASPEILGLRTIAEMLGKRIGKPPIFERRLDLVPATILPDLSCLASRYSLDSFRPFAVGLSDLI
ncbi:NAD-dependent epimerase/dehydratase family protein [Azospirillum sp. CT11-132]|uniref:NAD-dependent epimerase/dehydratase family protein n=1 Tax=Azospirillum sp. CT11-132 TaxID=3396317 RepID=UPI0039A52E5B